MKLIDADALIADLEKAMLLARTNEEIADLKLCKEIVRTAPTVSPDDVRGVAHWVTEKEAIDANDYSLRDTCSVCGHCDWDCTESMSFKYCPSCGAKMEVTDDA